MVNADFSVAASRSIDTLVNRKYTAASKYSIAWDKWSVSSSAAYFSLLASDNDR